MWAKRWMWLVIKRKFAIPFFKHNVHWVIIKVIKTFITLIQMIRKMTICQLPAIQSWNRFKTVILNSKPPVPLRIHLFVRILIIIAKVKSCHSLSVNRQMRSNGTLRSEMDYRTTCCLHVGVCQTQIIMSLVMNIPASLRYF